MTTSPAVNNSSNRKPLNSSDSLMPNLFPWTLHPVLASLIISLTLCKRIQSLPDGTPGYYCSRVPAGHGTERTAGDNGYTIEVNTLEDEPVKDYFLPETEYNVILRSDNKDVTFRGFAIAAFKERPFEDDLVGQMSVLTSDNTKPTVDCPGLMTHTKPNEKSKVVLRWKSPKSGSDCIYFKATVVKTREVWYKDDGKLTLRLCEKVSSFSWTEQGATGPSVTLGQISANINTNPEIKPCCACGSASYRIYFEGIWDAKKHRDFPADYLAKWSSIIGATHTKDFRMWEYNKIADKALKMAAELGVAKDMEEKLRQAGELIRTVIRMQDIPKSTGQETAQFSVTEQHHFLSLISSMDPSPDWFVGVNSLDLCTLNCEWVKSQTLYLYPIDAGTDMGETFVSANRALLPSDWETIQDVRIRYSNKSTSPFYSPNIQEKLQPFAKLMIEQTALKDRTCGPGATNYLDGLSQSSDEGKGPSDSKVPMDSKEFACYRGWYDWLPWSDCSVTCGWGIRKRERKPLDADCDLQKVTDPSLVYYQEEACQRMGPECAIDCQVTQWSSWSTCDCEIINVVSTRKRQIWTEPVFGGKSCPDLQQVRDCDCSL